MTHRKKENMTVLKHRVGPGCFVLAYKVLVFCRPAQSCKQTIAWLKLVRWLKAVSALFFSQETFEKLFNDVPEESMQNVNRVDCQH